MQLATVVLSIVLAVVLTWAVLTPRVRDGVVVKAGLICMAIAHATLAAHVSEMQPLHGLTHAMLLLSIGTTLVLFGVLVRLLHPRKPRRRSSDWFGDAPVSRGEVRR